MGGGLQGAAAAALAATGCEAGAAGWPSLLQAEAQEGQLFPSVYAVIVPSVAERKGTVMYRVQPGAIRCNLH